MKISRQLPDYVFNFVLFTKLVQNKNVVDIVDKRKPKNK